MTHDLDKLSTEELGKLFPIEIADYNPEWKNLFLLEKEKIKNSVGPGNIFRIEHIGSTAVPGLNSKPTMDILLEIKETINIDKIVLQLKNLDYHFIPRPDNPPPHMMFAKGYSSKGYIGQSFHIHIRYKGDWDEIIFRDYLIQNPGTAQKYYLLKKRLASEFRNDREGYTNSKSDFISEIVRKARSKDQK